MTTVLLKMYDGVNISTVPSGGQVYMGYINGAWPTYEGFVQKYPQAKHVSVTVQAFDQNGKIINAGDVLDVETGDATPQQAVPWIQARRAAGAHWAAVYCNESTWPAVQEAFAAAHLVPPFYIIAAYPGTYPYDGAVLIPGSVGHQYLNNQAVGYDESVVSENWVNSIGAPAPHPAPKPTTTPTQAQLDAQHLVALTNSTQAHVAVSHGWELWIWTGLKFAPAAGKLPQDTIEYADKNWVTPRAGSEA